MSNNYDTFENQIHKYIEAYNSSNNEMSLTSLFDLEMISKCVFHISYCLRSMCLKSTTFIMLGPVYTGKLSILNLS